MMPYLLRCFSLLLSGDGQVHKTHVSTDFVHAFSVPD